ncbi:glycosyltransferase family 4 protein, partial [bacterium]|nr:glycosyltransferase family 4 protein [bacterium]
QHIGLYSSVTRSIFDFPYILRIDGIYYDKKNTYGENQKLNEKIYKSIEKASGIIFQSEFSKKLVESHFGKINNKTTIILNGAKIDNGDYISNFSQKKTIVCSANWRPIKRLQSIIDTVKKLRQNIDCQLYILGDFNNIDIGEYDYIYRLGDQPSSVVYDYLRKANLFIHLSWLDSCPNSVIEAISQNVPVICSNLGGTPEIIKASRGGIISVCDDNINLKDLMDLHNPPKPNIDVIVNDALKILSNGSSYTKKIKTDTIDIVNVAGEYVKFCKKVLNEN